MMIPSGKQPEPIFELTRVWKTYGSLTALEDVTISILPGERVALVGPSGAGKSTLLGLLNGSLLPDCGVVKLLGKDISQLSTRHRRSIQSRIGMIYQQFHLVHNLRVIHNVNAGNLFRWPWWKAFLSLLRPLEVPAAHQALEQVGIAEKLYARTDQLSGGQMQRLALARVLVQDPLAILADEPIASLDPALGEGMMNLLRRLSRQTGKTLIASLHAIDFARSHFDRLIGLRHGRLQFDSPSNLVTHQELEELYHNDLPHAA